MPMNHKKILGTTVTLLTAGSFALPAHALCPVCTVAVGAGVGLSRWLGIDDTITGLWVGGLMVSLTLWTDDWLEKKNFKIQGRAWAVLAAYLILIILPLYWMGIMGHPFNTLWGQDKLLVGMIAGGFSFLVGALGYKALKKHNQDRAYFPFQKVVMPVGMLAILSAIFYWITK